LLQVASAVAAVAGVLGLGYSLHRASRDALRFADGSSAALLTPQSKLVARVDRPDSVEVVLIEGSARFEVSERASRSFALEAAAVTVRVAAARFVVERGIGGVWVSVDQGRVEAAGAAKKRSLGAGESFFFDEASPLPPGE